ncbi:cytochrome c [Rhodovulum iodosum]|uniref:Cytochrome c n=1 Tax=Rhodovulum iodosum TaxID=68291 RepID=A0ABV3XSJ6_9RHOB|nr:cytochrome c family protein [Rhodovulum robiginosum]RSK32844.1 cytochrome c family protein [Rhodovulum robiginosum]
MFDTMTLTKVVGAFCGALLIFLLTSWASDGLYHVGGHGHEEPVYPILAEDDGAEEAAEPVEEVPMAELLAAGDAGAGARVFGKCKACHKLEEGANAVGPSLYGVVGRAVGSISGFNYSGALDGTAEAWTPEELYAFLENPKAYAPGTSMSFAGLQKPEDRADVIAYLQAEGS